ncbi:MAG: YciE/YciF ferroxidase family protein [Methylovirgula sp.]
MAKQSKDLNDLFYETLRDIYFAEKQILKALPKMAKAAQSQELRKAFETHRDQTEGQIERLDQVFEMIGKAARGKTCEAVVGMIDEGKEVIEEFGGTAALDPGLIAGAQSIEHYEISRYGTLKSWAQQLGLTEAVTLLDATLAEEKETDVLLSKLSATTINRKAA